MTRTFWNAAVLGLLAIGTAGASSIQCSFNGGTLTSTGCYSSAAIFAPLGSVDWGTALGEAYSTAGNPHNLTTSALTVQTTNNFNVSVSLGSDASFSSVSRVDNTKYAWDGTQWTFPNVVSQAQNGQNIMTFAGHFNGPSAGNPYGDHLLATTDSSGNMSGGGALVLNFQSRIMSAGFQISTNGSANSNFDALVTAKNASGQTIGTYEVVDSGAGGICSLLTPADRHNVAFPAGCNDAPWIGFIDSTDQMTSLTIQAWDPVTLAALPFAIDTLQLNTDPPGTVPEPGSMALIGGALISFGLYTKRRVHSRNARTA